MLLATLVALDLTVVAFEATEARVEVELALVTRGLAAFAAAGAAQSITSLSGLLTLLLAMLEALEVALALVARCVVNKIKNTSKNIADHVSRSPSPLWAVPGGGAGGGAATTGGDSVKRETAVGVVL